MPLETATYISDLVVTNPANSDGLNQADDHMRLIKSAVKTTFPNFTAAALASTQAQIDAAVAAVVTRANATVPPGAIMDFGMPTAPAGWLECNGAAVSRTTYAALFAAIGTTWGAGDGSTTFNLPPTGDRFRRSRGSLGGAVGTLQSPCNLVHNHTGSGNTGGNSISLDHLHAFSGNTGTESAAHNHNIPSPAAKNGTSPGGSAYFGIWNNGLGGDATATSGTENQTHFHGFSGTTGAADRTLDHTHFYSFTTSVGSADNGAEARPYSATVLTCIKI